MGLGLIVLDNIRMLTIEIRFKKFSNKCKENTNVETIFLVEFSRTL